MKERLDIVLVDRGFAESREKAKTMIMEGNVFVKGKYLDANKRLLPDAIYDINGSTEPAVLYGMDVAMIPGDEGNFKITTKEDLRRFEAMTDRGI